MLGRKLSSWFYPTPTGDPGRDRNARTLQFACLQLACATALVALLNLHADEWVRMPTYILEVVLIGAAAAINRSGKWKWAAWTVTLAVFVTAILLVVEARDGFRSNAMLLFPQLLLISVMLLDRTSYLFTATAILLAVAALGIAERQGLTAAIPGVRSATSYGSIFFVELSILVFARIGIRIVRDTQSNVSDLRTIIDRLSAANAELEQSAEALRDSELRYRRLHESITDAVVAVDMDGHILETNPAFEAMLGYTGEELRRLPYQELTPEPWHDFEARVVAEQTLANGHSEVYEKECRRRDGTVFPVELRQYLLRNEANQPSGTWAIVRDVTERKRSEAALRESELRYREVFDHFSECIVVLDVTPEGRFRIAALNPAEEKATGLSNAAVAGKFVDEVLPEDTAQQTLAHYRECLEGGKVIHYDEELKMPIGVRYFHANLIPLRDASGRIHRIIDCSLDFTELKRAQEEAFARQKLESVGTLASGIAHDFNNLLGAVLAQADLALEEYASGAAPTEPLTVIQNLAVRGSEIVQQLMVYAGSESEVLELVDVSVVVEEMLQLLKVSVSKHALLEADLSERLPAVRGRAAQLRQVVMNLVTNASEAIGDRDGIIRLTTRRVTVSRAADAFPGVEEGEYVELVVADTGAGMSPQTRARVFDPFFTTKAAGRGLGLGVVHGIVRGFGGGIQIVTEPGKGATIRILLPSAETQADPATGQVSVAGAPAPAPRRFTVLVVEDEDSLRQAVVRMLRREGFEVLEAGNGSAAMDLVRAHGAHTDLVLLDMTIPGASSQEVLAEAAKVRPEIKVILTSAYSQETFKDTIALPQVRDFLRKPFRLADLVKLLRHAVLSGNLTGAS